MKMSHTYKSLVFLLLGATQIALLTLGQEIVVFNDDDKDLQSFESMLESEHFLSVDRPSQKRFRPISRSSSKSRAAKDVFQPLKNMSTSSSSPHVASSDDIKKLMIQAKAKGGGSAKSFGVNSLTYTRKPAGAVRWDEVPRRKDADWLAVEELFVPVAAEATGDGTPWKDEFDWNYGPVLSRHRRDLIAGSGQVLAKLSVVLDGTLTTDQAQDGSAANIQLKTEIQSALLLYLSSTFPDFDIEVNVSTVSSPNITVDAEILFEEDELTLAEIAQALVNLDTADSFKAGSAIYTVLYVALEPNTNADLLPAICFLCATSETCSQNLDDLTWFCAFNDTRFFPHGPLAGDGSMERGSEFATVQITFESEIPYESELLSSVWISVNGLLSFGEPFASFNPEPLPVDNRKLLAVYWSDLELSPDDTAEVYYQLYTKSATNTNAELAVLALANDAVVTYTTQNAYDATSVLVVTWDGTPPWPAELSLDERVTFQAIIISDGFTTYAMYIYGQGGMNFNPDINRAVEAGFLNINLDTRVNYYSFDTVIGNTGKLGMWIYAIGEATNYRALCLNWFRNELPSIQALALWNVIIPACPCSRAAADSSFFWLPAADGDANCRDMFPIFGQIGRRCCYRDGTDAFENRIPDVGPLFRFTPYYGDAANHELFDTQPYEWCCNQANLCSLYYIARPVRTCNRRNTRRGICFGDPHIKTLDQREYTFNGLGEFTLMEIDGTTADGVTTDFKLQGRTCRASAASGNLTDATVWCAMALRNTNGSSVHVTVSDTATDMIIFLNSQDYTVRFRETPDFAVSDGELYARKVNSSLSVSTPDGIGITISLLFGVLDYTLEVDDRYQTMTRGLLGNFNNDDSDDFIYPNGTVLPDSSSDREIYEYGLNWAITYEDSLFSYNFGENITTFTDASFEPIFLDEENKTVVQEAQSVCGGSSNLPCIFDYIATQNQDLALFTKTSIDQFTEVETSAANNAPTINGTSRINATVGENTTILVEASDPDNDPFSYVVLDNPTSGSFTIVNNSSGVFEAVYTPVSTDLELISIVAVDSNALESEVQQVTIATCPGCNGNGVCDFDAVSSTTSPFYYVAACICDAPYTGADCSGDRDGCEFNPCPQNTTCTDIPILEELATGRVYNCSDCPAGYVLNLNGTKCEDVDECADSTSCDINAQCANTLGGFVCTCDSGYRKAGDGSCRDIDECVENQNECSQVCENTVGSYNCSCNQGFQLDVIGGFECDREFFPCENFDKNCSYGCRNSTGEPECFCEIGKQLGSDNATCEDIDECEENLCSQGCTNTDGSFSCFCYTGYKLSDDRLACDQCGENKYGVECASTCNCRGRSVNNECDNVRGCICIPQWTGDTCSEDVDECQNDPTICPSTQICTNFDGGYSCDCPTGYQDLYNNGTCYNIDECLNPSVNQCPQDCEDNPGSFSCICRTGYNYNINNNTCDDIDECSAGISACDHMCTNKEGSYNCACMPGYVLTLDRVSCIKTTELCAAYNVNCSQGCTVEDDTPTCFCNIGYRLAADLATCLDIDECEGVNLCSDICENFDGSYNCSCPDGSSLLNDQRTCAACDDYHWGPNCANECGCNPVGSTGCDPITGCVCSEGWGGDTCYQDEDECSRIVSPCPDFSTCVNSAGTYTCQCNTGFQLSTDNVCEDIDECVTSSPCDQTCNNTVGSYVCSCQGGFRSDGDLCIDINECEVPSLHMCEQRCRNTDGGFYCECNTGYQLDVTDRQSCILLDETDGCAASNNCSDMCRVVNGTDTCYCMPGYELEANGLNCTDIDECATNPCDANGQCTNEAGTFNCSCNDGFRLAADLVTCQPCKFYTYGTECEQTCACVETNTAQCLATNGTCVCLDGWTGATCSDDIDECDGPSAVDCGSNAQCYNSQGSYRCVCDVGFSTLEGVCQPCGTTTWGQDCANLCDCVAANTLDCNNTDGTCTCLDGWQGTNCSEDVNECDTGDYCPGPNDTCSNLAGSAECVCDAGFSRPSQTEDCQDDDECLDPDVNTCAHPRTCINTKGSFSCDCKQGYVELNGTCQDVDECEDDSLNNCEHPRTCNNTEGSFTCDCKEGYQEVSGQCQDIDECQDPSLNTCEHPQFCNNTDGNFTCECLSGYLEVSGVCLEVDECLNDTLHTCVHPRECNNTAGNFTCVCKQGYVEVSGVCQDVDECQDSTLNTCQHPRICNNTVGNFTCDCKDGYLEVSGVCQDIDECSNSTLNTCEHPRTCNNTDGNYTCECKDGYTEVSGQCEDVDECQDQSLNSCQSPRVCNNTVGSFSCDCADGYLEVSGVCQVNFKGYEVVITLGFQVSDIDPAVFSDNTSTAFQLQAAVVEASILAYGRSLIQNAFLSVVVRSFRQGSVIADTTLSVDRLYSTNPDSDMTEVIYGLQNVGSIEINGSNVDVETVAIGSGDILPSESVKCDVFNQLTTCQDGYECQATNGTALCAEKDDDSDYELIVGLAVGIPLFVILAVVVGVLVYYYVRRTRSQQIQGRASSASTRSRDRDEPFRSVFATQMATKGSWGAPSRMQMYSPDAYSDAGTSESSGEGRLLKARQTRGGRLDFQDSAWFDQSLTGARSARTGASGTAITSGATARTPRDFSRDDAGGPTSNFSWEYMFKILEPHKGFEIQRPNLSSSPGPTHTPRTRHPDSMA